MTIEEIKSLANKYHTPGEKIKKDWHPAYQKECEKINRKELEKKIMKKYERFI
jgi:hypothetical protein